MKYRRRLQINAKRARELLRTAAKKRILVAGDLILDAFLWGTVERISPEAPVPVVHLTGESWYPGGAANVARNLREFSQHVSIAGLIGADDPGRRLRRLLEEQGIGLTGVVQDRSRPTTVKTRVIARQQQVVRVDREEGGPPAANATRKGAAAIGAAIHDADAVIVADYAKGYLQPEVAAAICDAAVGKIFTIDPSPSNPLNWTGATAMKPNRSEAIRVTGMIGRSPRQIGQRLLQQWDTSMVLLTLGEDGMMLFERGAQPFHTPARAREVFDVSGAGDTAIAVFTLALCAGAMPQEAAELANLASGIVVGKLGTAVVSRDELLGALEGKS